MSNASIYQYTADEHQQASALVRWLEKHEKSRAWLARTARLSSATVSQILNGKYPASPAEQLKEMRDAQRVSEERSDDGERAYVTTSISKLATAVCNRARKNAKFGIFTGFVGVGKTSALRQYQRANKHTVVLEANPDMTPGVMLRDLLGLVDAGCPRTMDDKFSLLVSTLRDTTTLLVLDEAETVQPRCLNYLRRISDKAGVGVVLAGTERLHQLIRPHHGTFDQIRSRVVMWAPIVKAISEDDANEIARALLPSAMPGQAITDQTLARLWQYADGSARMLTENLIPALRDYGQGKQLAPALIDAVAQKVLFLPAPKSN